MANAGGWATSNIIDAASKRPKLYNSGNNVIVDPNTKVSWAPPHSW